MALNRSVERLWLEQKKTRVRGRGSGTGEKGKGREGEEGKGGGGGRVRKRGQRGEREEGEGGGEGRIKCEISALPGLAVLFPLLPLFGTESAYVPGRSGFRILSLLCLECSCVTTSRQT